MPTRPSYKEAIQYLYEIEKYGMDLGLKRVEALLQSLDNPQDKLQIIHVGGTNGKGSTSAIIASILQKEGYRVGLYTSPHLMRFNERIRINGREISDKKVAELVEKIRCKSQESGVRSRHNSKLSSPTFFEFATAMAFLYFAEEKVDIAVMEVGLGGRLDATNVGKPLVSVITNIAKDHQAILGNSIKDIAFEKAGIIKKGGILISGETKPAALKVLTDECKNKKTMFYRLNRDFFADESLEPEVKTFAFQGRRWFYQKLTVNLLGRHQYFNTAAALAALEVLEEKGFYLTESSVRKGLRNVLWPGRLEIVSKKPLVVLDCAHNPAGAEVLKSALTAILCEARKMRLFLVLGIMADKDIKGMASKLVPLANTVILTRPKTERAASLEMLYKDIKPYRIMSQQSGVRGQKQEARGTRQEKRILLIDDVKDACRAAMSMANVDDIICIGGSVFTVGEARQALLEMAK